MKLAIALLLFYFLHSLLADHRIKAMLQRSIFPSRWYRILYNLIAVLTLLPILWYLTTLPQHFLFTTPPSLHAISYVGLAIGSLLLIQALRQYDLGEFSGLSYLHKNEKTNDQSSAENKKAPLLKINGWNSLVRHPLYFASLLLFWFYFLHAPSADFLLIASISTVYIYVGAKLEEQKLLETFGTDYQQYQQEVPMLIPRIYWRKPFLKN